MYVNAHTDTDIFSRCTLSHALALFSASCIVSFFEVTQRAQTTKSNSPCMSVLVRECNNQQWCSIGAYQTHSLSHKRIHTHTRIKQRSTCTVRHGVVELKIYENHGTCMYDFLYKTLNALAMQCAYVECSGHSI